jgi:hypothetical protein
VPSAEESRGTEEIVGEDRRHAAIARDNLLRPLSLLPVPPHSAVSQNGTRIPQSAVSRLADGVKIGVDIVPHLQGSESRHANRCED